MHDEEGEQIVVERYRDLVVRVADPDDRAAIATLHEASPDGGAVGFRVHNHGGPGAAEPAVHRRSVDVVAEVPGLGTVGAARISTGTLRVAGEPRPYALLSSLVVHPAHRRRGVAAGLARWRLDHAAGLAGEGAVVLANVQRGNTGSQANAARWADGWTGAAVTAPLTMLTRRARRPRYEVRDATAADSAAVASGHAAFTADHAFAHEWTPESLVEWLEAGPVNGYRVAIDPRGAVVAGMAVRREGLVRSLEVTRLPAYIAAVNVVLRAIPPDRVLRNVVVDHLWFAPGHQEAAADLLRETRWDWRDQGTHLLVTLDRRSPALPAVGLRPWSPTTVTTTAVRADPPVALDGPVEPIL